MVQTYTFLLWLALALLFNGNCLAQVTFQVTGLPAQTPADATLYISGNFEGWSGGQASYQLDTGAAGEPVITLPQMQGSIAFKFTRGSWGSVEKGPNGEEIPNRTYTFGGQGDTVDIIIDNWADLTGGGSTASDNVFILDEDFPIPQLMRDRRIWIYLPPDYETSSSSYPVIYMHDGQNLFDAATSFLGEWEVDETLNALHDTADLEVIVVGIDNGGVHRINEYSPWVNAQYGGGDGEQYIEFLAETLKPYVDSTYRTIPDAAVTGLMGSSMGGLISQYGAVARPDVFGKIGVFSPSFALFDSCFMHAYQNAGGVNADIFYLAGGMEGGSPNVVEATQLMVDTMIAAGVSPGQLHVVTDPDGEHTESFWRAYFDEAVLWLYGESSVSIEHTGALLEHVVLFPNPTFDFIEVRYADTTRTMHIRLVDMRGAELLQVTGTGSQQISVGHLSPGMYALKVKIGDQEGTYKVMKR